MSVSGSVGQLGFSIDARERLLSEAERIARVGSFAWDIASGAIHWSDELFRIFGLEPGSIRPTTETFFSAIHTDDVAKVQEVAGRGVATGVADPVEFRIVLPDQSIRHVRMNGAALFDAAGQPDRFVGTLVDVTDRLLSERELARRELVLRQAQRVAHVGSFEWMPESNEMRWSDELYRICGEEIGTAASMDRFAALVHPDDRGAFDELRAAALASSAPLLECRLVRADGQTRNVRVHAGSFHDERGERLGIIGSVHDITDLRKLETQLLQSQKMDALGRLAGGVAHDFNNLLTVIGLHVARLRREVSSSSLGAIAKAIDHASSLTHQLLAFSRQSTLTMRAVDVDAIVTDATQMVGRLLDANIRLVYEPCATAHAADADPAQLTQVLMNLLLNARDAMPRGGTITIRVENRSIAAGSRTPDLPIGDYVALSIRDEGMGMDECVRSRIFEPFFTTKEVGRGTGLGLSMVFGIVAQLGGAIEVDSVVDAGTLVTVLLPRSNRKLRAESIAPPVTERVRATILLVDDEQDLLAILADVLRDAGFVVHTAKSGDDALRRFEANPGAIEAIVSDVLMPGLSGPEVVTRIRAERPALPVVFISGHAPDSRTMSLDDASTRFLRKPFAPGELVAIVRDLLEHAPASASLSA